MHLLELEKYTDPRFNLTLTAAIDVPVLHSITLC